MKNDTVPVFILEIEGKYYWQFKNKKKNSIICRPNSKGDIPNTIKGAKNSFHHYAKINKIKRYSFAKFLDGIPTIQTQLL